jgi:hypothetical protein
MYRADRRHAAGIRGFTLHLPELSKHHAEVPDLTTNHSNSHLRYLHNNKGSGKGKQSDSLTHLNSQTNAARFHQMSQTARSGSTNEYKHKPPTPPVLRAHEDQLQWIRSTVWQEKKSHSMEQTLKASCTSSPCCSRRFHYPTHRVICINSLTPELNLSAQRCLTRFLLGILLLEPCISLIYV